MKIEEISIDSDYYPKQLRNIYDPPLKLFIMGNKELLKKNSIAIVGSRNATEYGKKIAFQFSKDLSDRGIIVISGLAIGIDAYAHLGALPNTIAVLGSRIR